MKNDKTQKNMFFTFKMEIIFKNITNAGEIKRPCVMSIKIYKFFYDQKQ